MATTNLANDGRGHRTARRPGNAVAIVLAAILLAALFAGCAGQSSSDSGGDGMAPSDSDTVSYANPNAAGVPLAGVPLNDGRARAPDDEASLDAVIWTTAPVIEAGALSAAGTLTQDARLYEPMNGEPSAFSVYYGDNAEVMVELLPDLGPMHVWDTDATVAPSDFELEGSDFTIRAYSPLFMDVGPSDLMLRVWGYDAAGETALLSAQAVDAR